MLAIPGMGPRMAAVIIAEVGDFKCVLQVKNPKIANKNGESCISVLEKSAAILAEPSSSARTVLQTYFQVNIYRFIRSWRSAMFL